MLRDVDAGWRLSSRLSRVEDAICILLRRIDALPRSADPSGLRLSAERCLREANEWTLTPPSGEDVESVMKRVLALHLAVTKLEKGAAAGSLTVAERSSPATTSPDPPR